MKIRESELSQEQVLMSSTAGVSSFEDFWMFLSFAMVLISFVLMGYVSYLKSVKVDNVERFVTEENLNNQEDNSEIPPEDIINVGVNRHKDGSVYFTIDDDLKTKLEYERLAEKLNLKIRDKERNENVFVIHAPGNYLYQDVMKVAFLIKGSEIKGDSKTVRLAYEEVLKDLKE
jgi:biopolymer transport protein ExbD